jgi:hypothetical protein
VQIPPPQPGVCPVFCFCAIFLPTTKSPRGRYLTATKSSWLPLQAYVSVVAESAAVSSAHRTQTHVPLDLRRLLDFLDLLFCHWRGHRLNHFPIACLSSKPLTFACDNSTTPDRHLYTSFHEGLFAGFLAKSGHFARLFTKAQLALGFFQYRQCRRMHAQETKHRTLQQEIPAFGQAGSGALGQDPPGAKTLSGPSRPGPGLGTRGRG